MYLYEAVANKHTLYLMYSSGTREGQIRPCVVMAVLTPAGSGKGKIKGLALFTFDVDLASRNSPLFAAGKAVACDKCFRTYDIKEVDVVRTEHNPLNATAAEATWRITAAGSPPAGFACLWTIDNPSAASLLPHPFFHLMV